MSPQSDHHCAKHINSESDSSATQLRKEEEKAQPKRRRKEAARSFLAYFLPYHTKRNPFLPLSSNLSPTNKETAVQFSLHPVETPTYFLKKEEVQERIESFNFKKMKEYKAKERAARNKPTGGSAERVGGIPPIGSSLCASTSIANPNKMDVRIRTENAESGNPLARIAAALL